MEERAAAGSTLDMEYNPLEVLSLMMPTMSDTGDEFCTAVRSLPPLLLTQALAAAPISAVESPLLTVPDELLNLIVGMLEPQDLANFAFLNSDCHQLARVVQFEHVKVDYPNMDLLLSLVDESRAGCNALGKPTRLVLGSCVRRLTVATSIWAFHCWHSFSLEDSVN